MNAKILLRKTIADILFLLGLIKPETRSRGRLSIVTFHRVLPDADRQAYPFPGLVVTPEELEEFLDYFTKYFDCGTLATQHERYTNDEFSERPLLAITFDDAQYDNYCYARPVLARHNVKASFFAPVDAIGKKELLWHDRLGFAVLTLLKRSPGGQEHLMQMLASAGLSASGPSSLVSNVVEAAKGLSLEARLCLVEELAEVSGLVSTPGFARLMTFEELAELAASGHEIGSHSMTHCLMPECDDGALSYEVAESRRILRNRLGQAVASFCYPNGNSDSRTAQAVAQAGYLRAVTTTWGSNGKDSDQFQLHRYDMVAKRVQDSRGKFVPTLLAFRMSGLYPGLG